eukprot:SAG31_NODE_1034_length_10228_cov_89.107316_5_plen_108_part_00
MSAAKGNGSFVSKPLLWHGGELKINADTMQGDEDATGSVTIHVVEQGRRSLSSLPFQGNQTNATVEWSGGGKLDASRGKTFVLEVWLSGAARLCSLRGDFEWASVTG